MREDTSQHSCQICNSARATHMCEDCGVVLCLECMETRTTNYHMCADCHHILGTPLPGEKFESCPECESEKLTLGKKLEDICPKCHSKHTTPIEERRRQLAQEMRSAINGLHYGYTKLKETSNRLVAAKRLLVSLRMANFLHYKWLEDRIEEIQNEIAAIKSRVSNQAEVLAKRMAAETKESIDYNTWAPAQFPLIEGIINRITELQIQYKRNIDEALEGIRVSLKDLDRQLEGLNYYRTQFTSFYDYAELRVNELPVCALPDVRIDGSDFLKNDKATGTLYITNMRMVFIAETGIVRKKTDVVFDFPLIYLSGFEEDGRLRKRLVLKMKQGDIRIACSEQTKKVLPDFVEIGKRFDRYVQTDLQRVRKLEQKEIAVSDIRIKIDGLVHSLFYGRSRQYDTGTYPYGRGTNNPHGAYGYESADDQSSTTGVFRDHLGRTIDRVAAGTRPRYPDHDNQDVKALRRNLMDLESAIRETVNLLRNGSLVSEEFIRRYRALMRDTYHTRKQIEGFSRDVRRNPW